MKKFWSKYDKLTIDILFVIALLTSIIMLIAAANIEI